jgi:hypothetical protein
MATVRDQLSKYLLLSEAVVARRDDGSDSAERSQFLCEDEMRRMERLLAERQTLMAAARRSHA